MEEIIKDELFDDELCGMVKFTDATTRPSQHVKSEKNQDNKEHAKEKKTAQKPTDETMDAEYQPVKTWYDPKTVNLVKWPVIFIGLEYLVFYWMQTGQMQESAAMPSMIVCVILAGISVCRNWKWSK